MTNKNFANDARTKLLLKIELEIEKFTESKSFNNFNYLNIYTLFCVISPPKFLKKLNKFFNI